MNLTFNHKYFIRFISLFLFEILISTYFKSGFIRYVLGDFLVVILLYCFIKSFINLNYFYTALYVLAFSYFIEFLQYVNFINYINLSSNKMANLILGNTFSLEDLIAYTIGIVTVLVIEVNVK
ncbi:ribosomal maturation YjgA family protein [Urechidicola croceus]|uniref:ribosomal maturation YjgA family protein n=1 Tax=Urechidicola croceus TaxID=1850246 RepID=UPI0009F5A532|nr:DUF2809 domain-containing protein [Urechidicola croceus]